MDKEKELVNKNVDQTEKPSDINTLEADRTQQIKNLELEKEVSGNRTEIDNLALDNSDKREGNYTPPWCEEIPYGNGMTIIKCSDIPVEPIHLKKKKLRWFWRLLLGDL